MLPLQRPYDGSTWERASEFPFFNTYVATTDPVYGTPLSQWSSREYPNPYDNNTADRAHVGIGLLPSGDVLHIVGVEYCSKQDLTNVASEFNPTWFQIFDGGGSVGVISEAQTSPLTAATQILGRAHLRSSSSLLYLGVHFGMSKSASSHPG